MRKRFLTTLLFLTALFLLSACSASFEEAQKETQTAVEEVFKEKPQKANNENKDINYYLPSGIDVESEDTSNVVLKDGKMEYRLFYNPLEDKKSELVYNVALEQHKFDVNKVYNDDERYGFLLIKKLDDKKNELVVGIGGVKVSSEVKTKNLAEEAAKMMEIANSVNMK